MKWLIGTLFWGLGATMVAFFSFFGPHSSADCTLPAVPSAEMANHGWNTLQSESLISFKPEKAAYCVPAGFAALGGTVSNDGLVSFPADGTGVFILLAQFEFKELLLEDGTTIQVAYSRQLDPETKEVYRQIVEKTFRDMSSLYTQFDLSTLQGHTILISEGIIGDSTTPESSVYPSPSKHLTTFVRNNNHPRGEALFIHAVAHLFNRYGSTTLSYQDKQAPVPASDWQEAEAAWTEIAFLSDDEARQRRVEELYAIHQAVQTDTFSPALAFPFNNKTTFKDVYRKSIILGEGPTAAEIEYSHYVAAPLVLVSIDGLLATHNASTSVAKLISEASGDNQNFFILLSTHLPDADMERVNSFLFGKEQIPYNLITLGLTRY